MGTGAVATDPYDSSQVLLGHGWPPAGASTPTRSGSGGDLLESSSGGTRQLGASWRSVSPQPGHSFQQHSRHGASAQGGTSIIQPRLGELSQSFWQTVAPDVHHAMLQHAFEQVMTLFTTLCVLYTCLQSRRDLHLATYSHQWLRGTRAKGSSTSFGGSGPGRSNLHHPHASAAVGQLLAAACTRRSCCSPCCNHAA